MVLKDRKKYTRKMYTSLVWTRSYECPVCSSTSLTRVKHSTSYDWLCENGHYYADQGAVRTTYIPKWR